MAQDQPVQSHREDVHHVGVIVIHGVGEVEAGWVNPYIVEPLTKAIAADADGAGLTLEPESEVYALRDGGATDKTAKFNAFLRRGHTADGSQVTVSEFYWADLSRVGRQPITQFFAMLQLLYEAPSVLTRSIMDKQTYKSFYHAIVRRLVLLAVGFVRWIEAGLTGAVILAALWIGVANAFLDPLSRLDIGQKYAVPAQLSGQVLLVALIVFLLITAAACSRLTSRSEHRNLGLTDVFASTAFWSLVGAVVLGILLFSGTRILTPTEYLQTAVRFSLFVWAGWNVLIVVATLLVLLLALKRMILSAPAGAPPLARTFSALGLAVLQGTLFKLVVALAGILIIDYRVPGDCRLLNADSPAKCFDSTFAYSQFIDLAFDRQQIAGAFTVNCAILAAALVIVLPLVFAGRLTHFFMRRADKTAKWRPRVILNGAVTFVLVAGTIINTFVFYGSYIRIGQDTLTTVVRKLLFPETLSQSQSFVSGMSGWLTMDYGAIAEASQLRLILLVGLLVIIVFYLMGSLQGFIAGVLHFARDVVDHQYRRKLGVPRLIAEVVMPGQTQKRKRQVTAEWPRRERIRMRLDEMMEMLAAQERFDRVVFLTHSQGSIIVHDYLRQSGASNPLLVGATDIHVVTLGSPLTHLYQYYFREYDDARVDDSLRITNLASWTNMWRIDDPIGDEVRLGTSEAVKNLPLGPGGHSDYWKDARVRRLIRELVTAAPAAKPMPTTG